MLFLRLIFCGAVICCNQWEN